MKLLLLAAPLFFAVAFGANPAGKGAAAIQTGASDKTITKVVKLLQQILEESKKEGEAERKLYAKYKCYCDDNENTKKDEISQLTEDIAVLESQIEKLLASSAVLSKELAKLKADIADIVSALASAKSVRDQEESAYNATKADLDTAIKAAEDAIVEIATVGADQTMASGADHKQFMSDFSLRQLKSHVKQALVAASMKVSVKQEKALKSFVQAPFTGSYTSQSGEVFGILKDMRDTFKANLEEATATEKKSKEAYLKFKKAKEDEKTDLETMQTTKNSELTANDGDLPTKRSALTTAEDDKSDAETFLSNLVDMCTTKAKEYEHRVMLRTNEQAAVAKAISILNSDNAFATFSKTDAASTGVLPTLFQLHAINHHVQKEIADGKERARTFLRGKADKTHSPLLSKVLAMLEVDNPFDTVLEEIQKMLKIIEEEGDADEEQLSWCNDERTANDKKLSDRATIISGLKGDISTLDTAINDPVTGLKVLITNAEDSLKANQDSQKTETEDRQEANALYKKNVANLVEAEGLLTKAIGVLEAYYKDLEQRQFSLMQSRQARANPATDPAPPSTWSDDAGQGSSGNDAVSMLKYILKESEDEEKTAHSDEATAQHAYEDSMAQLTQTEADLRNDLANYGESLAKKEEELLGKKKDLRDTEDEVKKIEAYLVSIKPGCDFITTNKDLRDSNRAEEKTALLSAETLLKESAAYKTAEAQEHNETLGDCLEFCAGDFLDTAKCKACRAGVTVPAYCAGHPGVTGCES